MLQKHVPLEALCIGDVVVLESPNGSTPTDWPFNYCIVCMVDDVSTVLLRPYAVWYEKGYHEIKPLSILLGDGQNSILLGNEQIEIPKPDNSLLYTVFNWELNHI